MGRQTTIGIDLAKNVFYFVQLSAAGKVEVRKKLSRGQVLQYLAQAARCVVAMEACGSANYWGREIQKLGHDVQLLPPQYVKGYARGQKNDYNDALAITEASQHSAIRPVKLKTLEQQDEQTFLRMRGHLVVERKRLINHIRGLLAEYGVVLPQGSNVLKKQIPEIPENKERRLTERMQTFLSRQYQHLVTLDEEIAWYNAQLEEKAYRDPVCSRLMAIPGIGPLVSQTLKVWMGDGQQFRRGRDASAALGLVPRQHSSGGKQVLLGITKRGSATVRSMIVHGARAVATRARKKHDSLSRWVNRIIETRGFNKAVVALANKMVRIAWALIAHQERFHITDWHTTPLLQLKPAMNRPAELQSEGGRLIHPIAHRTACVVRAHRYRGQGVDKLRIAGSGWLFRSD